ncbi:MAG: HlyD family secretion protein [Luteolibacter sp.]
MKTSIVASIFKALLRCVLTLALVLAGAHAARKVWAHYRVEPWTRDGRVNAEIVTIVPEVSGKISQLPVADNQLVQKGETLFVIDPEPYQLALRGAEATLSTREHELSLAKDQAERRRTLAAQHAISTEELQKAESSLSITTCAVESATAARDLARLNLERTTVTSPVNGYITNLHLRLGDYATTGQGQFAIIDRDSYWIAGYFEETKLPSVHVGDAARIDLMGGGHPLRGHVESMSRGIADAATGSKGLANVDPVFNWVRLAQRIPVRIHIDEVPDGVFLSSGMSCNVHLMPVAAEPEMAAPETLVRAGLVKKGDG